MHAQQYYQYMIPVFQEKAINLCAKWEKLQESANTGYSDVEMQKNLQTMVFGFFALFKVLPH